MLLLGCYGQDKCVATGLLGAVSHLEGCVLRRSHSKGAYIIEAVSLLGGCHVVARVLWTGQVRCYRFARGCVSFRRLRPPEVSFEGCIHHRGCLISEKQVGHSECDLRM